MAYFKSNTADVYYEIIGKGEPIIFLGGLMSYPKLWHELNNQLKEKFCCIIISYRGQDFTRLYEQFTIDDIIYDIKGIINDLGYKRVTIFGDAFGGFLARLFTCFYPEMVNKLILSSCSYVRDAVLNYKLLTWYKVLKNSNVEILYDVIFPDMFSRNFVEKNEAKLPELKNTNIDNKDKNNLISLFNAIFASNVTINHTNINHQTLVIQCLQDKIIHMGHGKELFDSFKYSHYLEMDCGHVPVLEMLPELIYSLKNFLNKN